MVDLLWGSKRKRVKLDTLQRTWECGGLEVPRLSLYYMVTQLQHAVQWLDENDNWEKWLLDGTHRRAPLSDLLTMGSKVPTHFPYIIRHVAATWGTAIKTSETSAICTEGALWAVVPFKQISQNMTITRWTEGGCCTMGDLYLGQWFLTREEAESKFELGRGQYLQYA